MELIKKQLSIGGMTCINCQTKIQKALTHTAGIHKVQVSYNKGTADIIYDPASITLDEIIAVIEGLDYKILKGRSSFADIRRTLRFSVMILFLYALLEESGVLNRLAPGQLADSRMGYGMLFLIGLITSVHCIAMCGGINLSQCIPHANTSSQESSLSSLCPAFLYNLGRVISYTLIGFLLGAAGMTIRGGLGNGLPILFQGILKFIAGIFMVIMGLTMLNLFPCLRRFSLRIPGPLAAVIGTKKLKEKRPFIIGILNGLMPCGPLQSMQILALASGSPLTGALSMLMFSLGTVPLMLGLGSIVSLLGRKYTRQLMDIGALFVIVLGLSMLSQGASLSGLFSPKLLLVLIAMLTILGVIASLPFESSLRREITLAALLLLVGSGCLISRYVSPAAGSGAASLEAEDPELVDGTQIITSTLTPGRYPDITVQAGIPVKWVINAPAKSINGCNYKMILPSYGITHEFIEGENVITFTPTQTGTQQYSCWMGMIRGSIFVVDGDAAPSEAPNDQTADIPVPSGYQIPSDQFAVAEASVDENGEDIQTVRIELTEDGFSPAVIVAQAGLPLIWEIDFSSDATASSVLLAPAYSSRLNLSPGENFLSLYPQDSFDVSTGDHRFYAYVKVVDDINDWDEAAVRQEVSGYETMIYPESVFEVPKRSCCS